LTGDGGAAKRSCLGRIDLCELWSAKRGTMLATTKTLLCAALTLLAGTLVSAAPAAAQEPTTFSGCLSKGPSKGTYTLTQDDGKTLALASTSVKLDEHVGHSITVDAKPAGIDAPVETGMAKDTGNVEDAGKPIETGMAKDTAHQRTGPTGGALNVTKVTHVAAKCK
jgi:hypothetical protein